MIGKNNKKFITTVFHKLTDDGQCLNAKSKCVEKYKSSVIFNYIKRSYKISQDWKEFYKEIKIIHKYWSITILV